jgi:hypothetical protein
MCYASAMHRPGFLAPLLLVALAPVLMAQAPTAWENVKHLTPGTDVRVKLMDGRTLRGGFESATDDALMMGTANSQETLNRAMIAKVSIRGKNHRLRNTLIGFGVGAAGGLIAGAVTDAETCHPNQFFGCFGGRDLGKEVLTPLGALVGAIVGVLLPTGGWHDVYSLK